MNCECGCNGTGKRRQMVPVRLLESADNDGRSSYARGKSWLVLRSCAAAFKEELHNGRLLDAAWLKWSKVSLLVRWWNWRLVKATCGLQELILVRRMGAHHATMAARKTWRVLMWPGWIHRGGAEARRGGGK